MTTVRIGSTGTRVTVGGATKRVTLSRATVAAIANNRPATTVVARNPAVSVGSGATNVTVGGAMGVQGAPGETEGATFQAACGSTIHGHRVVRIADGVIHHPDLATDTHAEQVVGIATQSGAIGATVLVRSGGQMTEPSWTWSPGAIWCGAGGQLTQSPGAIGWLLPVGRAIDATTIDVDIEPPIYR